MSEIERLLHLFVSLQILFGSRRGGIGAPLLVLALLVGGWFVYRSYFAAIPNLEKADIKYDSGDTKERMEAINDYVQLLRKRDPLEPQLFWLKEDRARLYRRIIEHYVLFRPEELAYASDLVHDAWAENVRDLDFHDQRAQDFWQSVVDKIKAKKK